MIDVLVNFDLFLLLFFFDFSFLGCSLLDDWFFFLFDLFHQSAHDSLGFRLEPFHFGGGVISLLVKSLHLV